MTKDNLQKPEDNGQNSSEAPSLIKNIVWLMNQKNWQQHWKPIILALLVLAAIPLYTKFKQYIPGESLSVTKNGQKDLLTEGQVRRAILNALHAGNADQATSYLAGLSEGSLRQEECAHVFEFCIKNGLLPEAEEVVKLCWGEDVRKEKLARIEREKLKQ